MEDSKINNFILTNKYSSRFFIQTEYNPCLFEPVTCFFQKKTVNLQPYFHDNLKKRRFYGYYSRY